MERRCEACGEALERGRRASARFCSDRCRKRYTRGARAPQLTVVESTGPGGVEQAAIAELEAVGRLGTFQGQLVVALARRMDEQDRDTGSGVAAVSRELRAARDAALADVSVEADPIDELRRRRDRKVGLTRER